MIPRKLKICLGCEKPKILYAHGYCLSCYPKHVAKKRISPNVKSVEHKRKDFRLSQPYAFEKAYYMWEGRNFITGDKIPKDELSYSNCAHVLAKGSYEWFRYYTRNIVLLSPEQHTLFDNITKEALAKRLKEHPEEDWQKLFNYSYQLLTEYNEWIKTVPKEYKL